MHISIFLNEGLFELIFFPLKYLISCLDHVGEKSFPFIESLTKYLFPHCSLTFFTSNLFTSQWQDSPKAGLFLI